MADTVVPSAQTTTVAASAKPALQALAPSGRQEIAAGGKGLPAAANASPVQATRPSTQEVERATRDIAEYIQTVNRSLQISVEKDIGTTIITVIDKATEEVVRQIPSEDVVALARYLSQQQAELGGTDISVKGLLMDSEG